MPRAVFIGSALSALMMLAGCDSKDTFSVDVAIYFLDQGETRVVRETYVYDVTIRADWQDIFDGAKARFSPTGEALVLQDEPVAVFGSYLTQQRDAARAMIWAHMEPGRTSPRLNTVNWGGSMSERFPDRFSETDVPRSYWPDFFEFPDPSDPASLRLGTSLEVQRVTVRLSDDDAALGDVAAALPWLTDAKPGAFCAFSLFKDLDERPACTQYGRADFLKVEGSFPEGKL